MLPVQRKVFYFILCLFVFFVTWLWCSLLCVRARHTKAKKNGNRRPVDILSGQNYAGGEWALYGKQLSEINPPLCCRDL